MRTRLRSHEAPGPARRLPVEPMAPASRVERELGAQIERAQVVAYLHRRGLRLEALAIESGDHRRHEQGGLIDGATIERRADLLRVLDEEGDVELAEILSALEVCEPEDVVQVQTDLATMRDAGILHCTSGSACWRIRAEALFDAMRLLAARSLEEG